MTALLPANLFQGLKYDETLTVEVVST